MRDKLNKNSNTVKIQLKLLSHKYMGSYTMILQEILENRESQMDFKLTKPEVGIGTGTKVRLF